MQIPRLLMHATYGKIGLNTENAQLEIRQQPAEQNILQPKAELSIHTVPGKLDIDQSQAFAEAHLKSIYALIDDYAARGKQEAMEGIARRAEQGDALMRIENGGHPIAEQARENSTPPPAQFSIGWMPKSPFSVKFHYQPAKVNIQWNVRQPQIEVRTHSPEYTYKPGRVDMNMKQWPSLDIQVAGGR
jgi:hypothetical protein